MHFRSARRIVRNVPLILSILAAMTVAGAAEKPVLPEVVPFENDGIAYKIDYSDFLAKRYEFALHGGCYQVSMSQQLGEGHGVAEDGIWREFMTRTICMDDWGTTIRDTAGEDHFEVAVPAVILHAGVRDGTEGVVATVAVNGHVESLDPALLNQLATGVAAGLLPAGVGEREEFVNLARHYSSDGWYHQALPLFQAAQELAGDRYTMPDLPGPVPLSCWKPCLQCAVYAGGTVVGGAALAASCATTFGATCIGGAVGVVRMAAGTLVSCSNCRDCRGGGRLPACGEGYSICCDKQCCSDSAPPPDCGPTDQNR